MKIEYTSSPESKRMENTNKVPDNTLWYLLEEATYYGRYRDTYYQWWLTNPEECSTLLIQKVIRRLKTFLTLEEDLNSNQEESVSKSIREIIDTKFFSNVRMPKQKDDSDIPSALRTMNWKKIVKPSYDDAQTYRSQITEALKDTDNGPIRYLTFVYHFINKLILEEGCNAFTLLREKRGDMLALLRYEFLENIWEFYYANKEKYDRYMGVTLACFEAVLRPQLSKKNGK